MTLCKRFIYSATVLLLCLFGLISSRAAYAEQITGEIPPIPCASLVSPQFAAQLAVEGFSPEQFQPLQTDSERHVTCTILGTMTFVGYFGYSYALPEERASRTAEREQFLVAQTPTAIGEVLTYRNNSDGPPSYYFALEENDYFYQVDIPNPGDDPTGEIIPTPSQLVIDQLAWLKQQVNDQLAILYPPVEETPPTATVPGSVDTPSVLSQLHKFEPASITPSGAAAVGATSIVFAALLAFPTRLMQAGISKNYSRYVARYRLMTVGVKTRFDRVMNGVGRVPRLVKLGIGLAIASFISGFLNPGFGFNGESLRVFSSIFVSNLIETVLVFGILLLLLKKRGVKATVSLKLGSLLIVLVSVLASRITGFEPGIVFGLVLSLVVLSPGVHKSSLMIFVEWLILVVLGLSTWLVFSSLPPVVDGETSAVIILASETLSSLTIGALASLPIAMLPFSGLPGKTVSDESWIKWSAIYAATLVLFFTVVMPFPGSFAEVTKPFGVWVLLFVAYAVIALGFYVFSLYKNKPTHSQ